MGKKILVCDDDEAILEMIKIMLEDANYQVKLISNGKAIQKKVIEYQPDLILIDLWMPGIDGKEAVLLLKRNPRTKDIPIIVISALHKNEISQIVKKIKAQGFLPKPFEMDNLLSIVKKYAI